MKNSKYQIVFLTTYPPRECGIATFTQDLVEELDKIHSLEPQKVVAINNEKYDYDSRVIFEIEQKCLGSYLETAEKINNSDIDLICIELEFGIFGGESGDYVLDFANALRKPIVTTLHTVLTSPTEKQKQIINEIGQKSTKIVTMTNNSKKILIDVYDIPNEKIEVIHHGVPFRMLQSSEELKEKYGLTGKKVVSTFGLLSPGKGIEYAIEAIGKIANKFDDLVYLILGQTHPAVKKQHGEAYRNSLKEIIKNMGIEDKVKFVDKYFEKQELLEYLKLSDIYMTPYLNMEQAVSGTLAYAVGYGKAIVSTPYKYAEEMLDNGRGIIVPPQNSDALANALEKILCDENCQKRFEQATAEFGTDMMWTSVAVNYSKVFINAIKENKKILEEKQNV